MQVVKQASCTKYDAVISLQCYALQIAEWWRKIPSRKSSFRPRKLSWVYEHWFAAEQRKKGIIVLATDGNLLADKHRLIAVVDFADSNSPLAHSITWSSDS